jgi:hypothetical protein
MSASILENGNQRRPFVGRDGIKYKKKEPLHYDVELIPLIIKKIEIQEKVTDSLSKKTHPLIIDVSEPRVRQTMSVAGGEVGIVDSLERAAVVPVVSTDDDGGLSDVQAVEAKVMAGETAVLLEDVLEVTCDDVIIAGTASRDTSEVTLEVTQATVELLEDNDLGLDIADLLNNNSEKKE